MRFYTGISIGYLTNCPRQDKCFSVCVWAGLQVTTETMALLLLLLKLELLMAALLLKLLLPFIIEGREVEFCTNRGGTKNSPLHID